MTCLSGVMASKSGFKAGGPRSFPRRDSMSLLGNFDIEPFLKIIWGKAEGLMLLFRGALFVGERVVRREGGKCGRVMG